jgi:hypothetical protein
MIGLGLAGGMRLRMMGCDIARSRPDPPGLHIVAAAERSVGVRMQVGSEASVIVDFGVVVVVGSQQAALESDLDQSATDGA